MNEILSRICITCGMDKALEEFYRSKIHAFGRMPQCKVCNSERARRWRIENASRFKAGQKRHREANAGYVKDYLAAWGKQNREKTRSYGLKRRAARKRACPTWLTKEQLREMVDLCAEATREECHVDHIVPINGILVCGLHVPWNLQVLSPYDNLCKSNRHESDEWIPLWPTITE